MRVATSVLWPRKGFVLSPGLRTPCGVGGYSLGLLVPCLQHVRVCVEASGEQVQCGMG